MRPILPLLVLVLLLQACDCVPVEDADIRGGSAGARAVVAGAVVEFVGAVGAERVCVPHIEITEVRRGDGRYNPITRGVRLDPGLDDPTYRTDTLHELCHAVDVQEDVSKAQPELWSLDDPGPYGTGRRRQRLEAFAWTCQVGPLAVHLLDAARCGEGDRLGDAVGVLADRVYVETFIGPARTWVPEVQAPLDELLIDAPEAVEHVTFTPTDDGLLRLEVSHAEGTTITSVDPETGASMGYDLGAEVLDSWVWQHPPGLAILRDAAGFEEGPVAAAVQTDLVPYHDDGDPRVVHWDGETWSPSDPPCLDGRDLFVLDGEIHAGGYDPDSGVVQWGPFR